ncbi:MAG TPA: hypothetical protein PKD10_06395 [Paracoccaceae bacterium]|nr:hypothetical protein [Paracoccaceae bacterium]
MADGMPPINFDYATDGAPVVIVAEAPAKNLDEALRLAPALGDPKWTAAYAQVANHLAHGDRFSVILDPEAFRTGYLAQREAEDPAEAPAPGRIRLRNYGIPAFDTIARPGMEGGSLVFFAVNTSLGIPYRVTMAPGAAPVYRPVAMTN